jgi:hypothetical protein
MYRAFAFFVFFFSRSLCAQNASQWAAASVDFRPIGVVVNGETFWAFGSNEGIAASADGTAWQSQHRAMARGGALLLGLDFPSAQFGFAYGTGGLVLFTSDSGQTWTPKRFGTETILAASFSDPGHGIFRTASSIFYVVNNDLHSVQLPSNVPKDFSYAPAVAALSPTQMTVALSEGWRS